MLEEPEMLTRSELERELTGFQPNGGEDHFRRLLVREAELGSAAGAVFLAHYTRYYWSDNELSELAIRYLNQVIELGNDDVDVGLAYYMKQSLVEFLGNPDPHVSRKWLEEALTRLPHSVGPALKLAEVMAEMGEHGVCEQLLGLAQRNAEASQLPEQDEFTYASILEVDSSPASVAEAAQRIRRRMRRTE
jgi:hypothetical protein